MKYQRVIKYFLFITMVFLNMNCSSVATLTFNYNGIVYSSTDFEQVSGGYHVNSAEAQEAWRTNNVKYSPLLTIYDIFIAYYSARINKSTSLDWQENPPVWLVILGPIIVISGLIYIISSAHSGI